MRITEVRVKLMDEPHDRLLAFCSVTFEGSFVIRDLKLIQGKCGLFVAMPSRKLMDHCRDCGAKNHLRAQFCNQCGERLRDDRAFKDDEGRSKLYADIAHPIHSDCREHIQTEVLRAFENERVLAQEPNYVCQYDDLGEERRCERGETNGAAPGGPVNHRFDTADGLRGQHRALVMETVRSGPILSHEDEFGDGLL